MEAFHLHPPLAAFPFVCFLLLAGVECIHLIRRNRSLESVASLLLAVGVVTAVATFFSGYQASEQANQTFMVSDDAIATHHNSGKLLLYFVIGTAIAYAVAQRARYSRGWFYALYGALLCVSTVLVVLTGYRGGELVFRHGAGVLAPYTALKPQ